MFDTYINIVLQRRWLVMLVMVLIFGFSAAGLGQLGFSSDYRDFFHSDDPQLMAFEEMQKKYAKSNNVFIAIATDQDTIFTHDTLTVLRKLTESAWRLPYVTRVDSLTNYQYIKGEGDELRVHDMVESPVSTDIQVLAALKKTVLNEPMLVDLLISRNTRVAGINLSISPGGVTDTGKPELEKALHAWVAQGKAKSPALEFYLSGSVLVDRAFDVEAERDMVTLYPIMIIVLFILTFTIMRSLVATLGTVLVVVLSAMAGLGFAGTLGIKLTAISVTAPIVLMPIGIAHCVHLVLSAQEAIGNRLDRNTAISTSLRTNFFPICLTSITTIIGFIAMTTSEVPPLVDLGIIVAAGLFFTHMLAITLMPAFLATFGLGVRRHKDTSKGYAALARGVSGRARLVFTVFVLVILTSLALIGRIQINDNFVEYLTDEVPVHRDTNFITQNLTGVHQVYYSVGAGNPQGVFEPDYLLRLDAFAEWLRDQSGVRHVQSMAEVIKRLNQEMNGGDQSFYRIPMDRALAAQYFFLYQLSLPLGLSATDRVDINQSATRVTVTLDNLGSREILWIDRCAQEWLTEHGKPAMQACGTGPTLMFAEIGQRNARSLVTGNLISFLLISLIIMVALRSLKLGGLSLVPNLVPALIAFGVWGLVDGEVGLAVSIVTVMTFGIIVDDTIHSMVHYQKARSTERNVTYALSETYKKKGRAVVGTSIILVSGFLVLTLSSFRMNKSMGVMTAMVIAFALVSDLLLLPSLLTIFDRQRIKQG